MNHNSYLCKFIYEHPDDWEEVLTSEDYNLKIKKDRDLAIFNYNINADFYNPLIQEARGIIINFKELEVVCWPFRKFGNFGEGYADKIHWNTAQVQEKVDGSIMKLWFNKITNKWQISSNSTIDAKEANLECGKNLGDLFLEAANKQNLNYDNLNKAYTYIFELVSPYNRVIIKYPEVKIYHTGTRYNFTGMEFNIDIGIVKPKNFPINNLENCIQAAKDLNFDRNNTDLAQEGFVVVDSKWNRIKIKSPEYICVHNMLNNGILSANKKVDLVVNGEMEEFLSYYPNCRPDIEITLTKINLLKEHIEEKVNYFKDLWKKYNPDIKSFALAIKDDPRKAWAFSAIKNNKTAKDIFQDFTKSRLYEEVNKIEVPLVSNISISAIKVNNTKIDFNMEVKNE